jgi:methylenetetrahydrofolate--tRNA-(uracil-5-)-methyltransferase
LIPGLENARFVRLGTVHRNTFICAPKHLDAQLRLNGRPSVRLAGQLTGVEGYVESAAIGLLAGLSLASELRGITLPPPPPWTAHGGLVRHLTERPPHRFQPANAAWGLMTDPPTELPGEKAQRRRGAVAAALAAIGAWRGAIGWEVPAVPPLR